MKIEMVQNEVTPAVQLVEKMFPALNLKGMEDLLASVKLSGAMTILTESGLEIDLSIIKLVTP